MNLSLLGLSGGMIALITVLGVLAACFIIIICLVPIKQGFIALVSGAHISMGRLIGMRMRRVKITPIVAAYIQARKAGIDLDIVDLNRTKGIVGDADIRGRRDCAVCADCDGEDGRDGDVHLRGGGVTVKGAVRGGRQADAGGTGTAGDVYRGGFGSGCANGKACHEADSEEQGYEFLHVLHSWFSFTLC